jgi:hypothetical protein
MDPHSKVKGTYNTTLVGIMTSFHVFHLKSPVFVATYNKEFGARENKLMETFFQSFPFVLG